MSLAWYCLARSICMHVHPLNIIIRITASHKHNPLPTNWPSAERLQVWMGSSHQNLWDNCSNCHVLPAQYAMLAQWSSGYGSALATWWLRVWILAAAVNTGTGDCVWVGKPPQYFTKPPRPTQPPTPAGYEMSPSQSAVTLYSWAVKAGMVHSTCG